MTLKNKKKNIMKTTKKFQINLSKQSDAVRDIKSMIELKEVPINE